MSAPTPGAVVAYDAAPARLAVVLAVDGEWLIARPLGECRPMAIRAEDAWVILDAMP